jgi:5-methylcytosine-specific restriction endonuclease McrA
MYITAKDSNAEKVKRAQDKFRKNEEVNKMYTHGRSGSAWRRLAPLMRVLNPICCRLYDGEQCHNPATVTHHLISPRRNARLFLEPTNLTTLCAHCHPDDDTPEWRAGVDIVQTRYPKYSIGE